MGFARKVVEAAYATANWFLFGRSGGESVREDVNGNREACVLAECGFTLTGGGSFQFGESYILAQFNTVRAHSLGAKVGDYLKAVRTVVLQLAESRLIG